MRRYRANPVAGWESLHTRSDAALQFWEMEKLDECPTKNQRNEEYYNEVIGKFIAEYALLVGDKENLGDAKANVSDDQTIKPDRAR